MSGGARLGEYGPCERGRRARGWSVERLAGLADVPVGVVRELEGGRVARLRVEVLMRVSVALGLSVLDLVPGFGQRHFAGGGVVETVKWEGRRNRVGEAVVELLRSEGGRMKAGDVMRVVGTRFGCSGRTVKRAALEAGIVVGRISQRGKWGVQGSFDWSLPEGEGGDQSSE